MQNRCLAVGVAVFTDAKVDLVLIRVIVADNPRMGSAGAAWMVSSMLFYDLLW